MLVEPELRPVTQPSAPRHRPPVPDDVSRRVRRNRTIATALVLAVATALVLGLSSGGHSAPASLVHVKVHHTSGANPRLSPSWEGDGKAVTMAFGGDTNFPSGSLLGDELAANPSTALGSGVRQLLSGVNLSMVNFESAMTNGTCPVPQPKSYDFYAPPTALTAFKAAGITLVTEANNHGMDCGAPGLQMALAARANAHYPVLGIGQNAAQAFSSYQAVLEGQHIGIIAATQVIDTELIASWTATNQKPGLASAYQVPALLAAVEADRKVDDTVVVFLHWGVQLDACPDPLQEPLAAALVRAGADIVIGSHAHVLLGGGYLGSAYVDYGLGNFAFYNAPYPTNYSGSLVLTAIGRRIVHATWRPAIIVNEQPVPVSGSQAAAVLSDLAGARACTNVTAGPTAPLATSATEQAPASAAVTAQLEAGN